MGGAGWRGGGLGEKAVHGSKGTTVRQGKESVAISRPVCLRLTLQTAGLATTGLYLDFYMFRF